MAKRTRSERYVASDEITRDLVDRKEHDVIGYLSRAAVDYLSGVDDRLRFYYKGPERIKSWSETEMLEVVPDRYHDLIVELAALYTVVEEQQPSPAPDRAPPDELARQDIRPSEKELAETYTANYIEAERRAGRTPTQTGLEQSARNAGINRTHLREAFHKLHEVRRGRRRKSAE
jgi:hypothetical protein